MNVTNYHTDTANPIIDPLNKGLGAFQQALPATDVKALNWNLLHEDLSLPTAVLYEERMTHNLQWMQQFVTEYGVKLAPHGKTTMAPKLFAHQLAGGAWGITLATAHQTRVAYQHGVRRVIMANQLVGKQNMAIISDLLADLSFDFCCLVDSADGVDQLGAFFKGRNQKLNVLLELGADGGRTGVRNAEQQTAVLDAIARWPDHIVLAGVELYEGVLKEEADIRSFLQHAVACTKQLAKDGRFAERAARQPVILTGAGSAWYDVVADEFVKTDIGLPLDVVLRPGCYLTHDVGIYRAAQAQIQTRNPIARKMRTELLPALQLWAYVQSIPETGKAIIALGKRDAAFDAGLPLPAAHYRPGSIAPTATPAHWQLTGMMDQHAYLQINAGDDIKVGDMIGFDISHPCLTFDKWRHIAVLNPQHEVVDVIQTFF
ncbi:putative D-serine deaminase (D-serine dehydratase) protein [Collimonas arenae]|uniref:Putative D-serine deaminase (D-serine dehydratase) protein n=1 Tax=Collimonas arenae TaxID=279058 RepID=A0A127PTB9_9BURK|nr:amino acid deaminase [Collimonas arenae]AMP01006.1 putative D-serine deaminase (D-serine dehydratase) protein [Collimonas arenae]AMP10898.1 putative D-serine deaminase (D-serine dehydratase) protein [Collimonas arenae]